jgi:hypothetical protein
VVASIAVVQGAAEVPMAESWLVDHSNRTSVDHFDQAVRQVAVGASVVVNLKEKPKVTVAEAIEPATDIAGVAEAVVLGAAYRKEEATC